MQKEYILRSLQSFVVIPILATSFTLSPMNFVEKIPTVAVLANVQNGTLSNEALDNKQKDLEEKAQKIDAYFGKYNLPLEGHGKEFVLAAEKNNLPWALVAAIGMAESTGCKFIIKGTNNCFGWGGGTIPFDSIDDAIATISEHLGGNNQHTDQYYSGKDVVGILHAYNPEEIAPGYAKHVQNIMQRIENFQTDNLADTATKKSA